jgi:hypothetical protein
VGGKAIETDKKRLNRQDAKNAKRNLTPLRFA